MENGRLICTEVQANLKEAVESQCDQPMHVIEAFEAVKTESQKIVSDAVEKMLGAVTTNLDGLLEGRKNKICKILQEHLNSSKRLGEYLYTCKVASKLHYILTSHTHSAQKHADRDIPSI